MLDSLATYALETIADVLPIAVVVGAFLVLVARARPARWRQILVGAAYLVLGLTLFRIGLDVTLVPMGLLMAEQLAAGHLVGLVVFAGAIGLAATLVEPTLIAVAGRAEESSGGAIRADALRLVVAIGVGAGMMIGVLRIVLGIPLAYPLLTSIGLIALLSWRAPRLILPLAYDSGALATSLVVVPLVAALGVGVATVLPGRSAEDGFGLIVMALLMPIVAVLSYARLERRWRRKQEGDDNAV